MRNFLKIKTVFGDTLINLDDVKIIYADKESNGTMFVFDEECHTVAIETFKTVSQRIFQLEKDEVTT